MTKNKYPIEYHELIDILNENRKKTIQWFAGIASTLIVALIIASVTFVSNLNREVKRIDIIQRDNITRIDNVEFYTGKITEKLFNVNPYTRGGVLKD